MIIVNWSCPFLEPNAFRNVLNTHPVIYSIRYRYLIENHKLSYIYEGYLRKFSLVTCQHNFSAKLCKITYVEWHNRFNKDQISLDNFIIVRLTEIWNCMHRGLLTDSRITRFLQHGMVMTGRAHVYDRLCRLLYMTFVTCARRKRDTSSVTVPKETGFVQYDLKFQIT